MWRLSARVWGPGSSCSQRTTAATESVDRSYFGIRRDEVREALRSGCRGALRTGCGAIGKNVRNGPDVVAPDAFKENGLHSNLPWRKIHCGTCIRSVGLRVEWPSGRYLQLTSKLVYLDTLVMGATIAILRRVGMAPVLSKSAAEAKRLRWRLRGFVCARKRRVWRTGTFVSGSRRLIKQEN